MTMDGSEFQFTTRDPARHTRRLALYRGTYGCGDRSRPLAAGADVRYGRQSPCLYSPDLKDEV